MCLRKFSPEPDDRKLALVYAAWPSANCCLSFGSLKGSMPAFFYEETNP